MGTASSHWKPRGDNTLQRTHCFSPGNYLKILVSDLEGKYDLTEGSELEELGSRRQERSGCLQEKNVDP